jgi:BirA family biotin operon repressor/biotin-[acetyl-CoA-carboxylase] ligase
VALIRALHQCGVEGARLKWPNDVLGPQGKLAGILIEAQGDMLGPSAVVIGVGINLKLPPQVLQQIDQAVTDLSHMTAAMPERNQLLALLLAELANVLREFGVHGFAGLHAEWESYHALQKQAVRLHLPDGKDIRGVVLGVTPEGALLLETPCRVTGQPEIRVFNAGEISLRSDANAAA